MTEIAWSPIRRLMKQNGADIVSRSAVSKLIRYLEKEVQEITELALKLTVHAKRKKVSADDIDLAIKYN